MGSSPETRESSHLPFLDYLRGAAILAVFLFHSVGATFGATDQLVWHGSFRNFHVAHSFLVLLPFTVGWYGVSLFFVISGFCIHLSHERSRDKSFTVFFLRRFFRIYPPYLLALLIFAACRLDFRFHFAESLLTLTKHLLLVNNFIHGPGGINGAFWSIAVECQLYALYPLLVFIAFRGGGWRSVMLFVAIAQLLLPSLTPGFGRSPFAMWYIWAIGAALADSWLKGGVLFFRWMPCYYWFLIALVCYFYRPIVFLSEAAFGLGAASFIAYCLEQPERIFPRHPGFWMNHLRVTGVVSYSAYLLHQPMMKFSLLLFRKIFHIHYLPPLLSFAFCVSTWLIVFPTSWLFHKYIEQPSIAFGKWVIERRRHREFLSGDGPAKTESAA